MSRNGSTSSSPNVGKGRRTTKPAPSVWRWAVTNRAISLVTLPSFAGVMTRQCDHDSARVKCRRAALGAPHGVGKQYGYNEPHLKPNGQLKSALQGMPQKFATQTDALAPGRAGSQGVASAPAHDLTHAP